MGDDVVDIAAMGGVADGQAGQGSGAEAQRCQVGQEHVAAGNGAADAAATSGNLYRRLTPKMAGSLMPNRVEMKEGMQSSLTLLFFS